MRWRRSRRQQTGGNLLVVLPALLFFMVLTGCAGDAPAETPTRTPTPGPGERFQTPATFSSYRYTMELTANPSIIDDSNAPEGLDLGGVALHVTIEGERVNPDREFAHQSFSFGPLVVERETLAIGESVWIRQEEGPWRKRPALTTPEDLLGQEFMLSPHSLFGNDDPQLLADLTTDLEARPHTFETVRGRETRHWQLDRTWFTAYSEDFVELLESVLRTEELTIDVWTDIQTGVGIKLLVTAATDEDPEALRLTMDIVDINDPGIVVEEPPGAIEP